MASRTTTTTTTFQAVAAGSSAQFPEDIVRIITTLTEAAHKLEQHQQQQEQQQNMFTAQSQQQLTSIAMGGDVPIQSILEDQWALSSYIALSVGVFLLAFLAEALKASHRVQDAVCAQEAIENAPLQSTQRMRFWLKVKYPWGEQLIRTLEHTLKLGIRFLCFYICVLTPGRVAFLSMLAGTAAGYLLLRRMQPPPVTVSVGAQDYSTASTLPPSFSLLDVKEDLSEPSSMPPQIQPAATQQTGTWHVCTNPDELV